MHSIQYSALKKKIREAKDGRFMEKDKRIVEELKCLHCDPHPFFRVYPSESDLTFWRILMQGPPDTPYEKGVFELYCQFGPEYPVKPPLIRFVTRGNIKVVISAELFCDSCRAYFFQMLFQTPDMNTYICILTFSWKHFSRGIPDEPRDVRTRSQKAHGGTCWKVNG
uniref:UBC core domain-containing protein n=1 Tax=Oreochromis niloticus TaxID=8128 RepID=A0A669BTH2_ORENI